MEAISVLDIFKVGIGPSSSHTMGPWKAANRFRTELESRGGQGRIEVHLYGSLAKTGKGHGTDLAVQLGLLGLDVSATDPDEIQGHLDGIAASGLVGSWEFHPENDIQFHRDQSLPEHPNGMVFRLVSPAGDAELTAFSVGGGFVKYRGESGAVTAGPILLHPHESGAELEALASGQGLCETLWQNETAFRSRVETEAGLDRIWEVMLKCVHRGCHQGGSLPGGLNVKRRAAAISESLLGHPLPHDLERWMLDIKLSDPGFESVLKWVSAFALAVNEENAAFGRVVTAPTNGAAGVIPSVLLYAVLFRHIKARDIREFLLVAGAVGILFKKGATISAAMGGCQAEIGVSSAMAAAGLTHVRGGTPEQALMAAEIAMEHHLGMTCDPIGGLVQVPCIERNSMGAMKAITAAGIALESDPSEAKVPLDAVIRSMWETAQDMHSKYKETSEGGLAVQIPVSVSEC